MSYKKLQINQIQVNLENFKSILLEETKNLCGETTGKPARTRKTVVERKNVLRGCQEHIFSRTQFVFFRRALPLKVFLGHYFCLNKLNVFAHAGSFRQSVLSNKPENFRFVRVAFEKSDKVKSSKKQSNKHKTNFFEGH